MSLLSSLLVLPYLDYIFLYRNCFAPGTHFHEGNKILNPTYEEIMENEDESLKEK